MNFYKLDGYLKTAVGGTNIQYYPAKEGGFLIIIMKEEV